MPRTRLLASGAGAACLLLGLGAGPVHAAAPVIAAAGDVACDPDGASFNNGDGDATRCHQKYTSNLLLGDLAAVLVLGDTQYEDGLLSQFQLSYDPSWGRVKPITRPAIGNHEYRLSPGTGYFDYFNGVGEGTGLAGERGKGYYSFNVGDSFDVGGWHLIALNSMCDQVGGCHAGSVQEQWLRADLAANAAAGCTLAYWHHPLFNSGPDGSYKDTIWNTTDLWQALYDAGADLVLNGHSHTYQRFGAQDPSGSADPQYGLREFVVGTGGKSLGNFGDAQPNLELRDNTQYGVIKLVLHPNGYDWTFVDDSGVTRDSGSAGCHGSPPPDTTISAGPTGRINTTSTSFSFASSETGSTFKCTLDGPGSALGTETTCSSPQPYSGLAEGAYTFSVYAIDSTGTADPTPARRSFTVDITAPETSISAATIKKSGATFSFASSEAGSTFTCRLDTGPWASCTSPRTYNGLSAGGHTFEVYATDAAGNPDPTQAAHNFTIAKGRAKSSSSVRLGLNLPAIAN